MEGLFAVLVGAVAIAAAPLVPVVRPIAKAAVVASLALADTATTAATAAVAAVAVVGHQWEQLRGTKAADGSGDSVGQEVVATAAVETVEDGSAVVNAAPAEAVSASEHADAPMETEADEPSGAEDSVVEDSAAARVDDLTLVEGIGPKVASILTAAGIADLNALAAATEAQLRAILAEAGSRYKGMNPASWPEQANLLLSST